MQPKLVHADDSILIGHSSLVTVALPAHESAYTVSAIGDEAIFDRIVLVNGEQMVCDGWDKRISLLLPPSEIDRIAIFSVMYPLGTKPGVKDVQVVVHNEREQYAVIHAWNLQGTAKIRLACEGPEAILGDTAPLTVHMTNTGTIDTTISLKIDTTVVGSYLVHAGKIKTIEVETVAQVPEHVLMATDVATNIILKTAQFKRKILRGVAIDGVLKRLGKGNSILIKIRNTGDTTCVDAVIDITDAEGHIQPVSIPIPPLAPHAKTTLEAALNIPVTHPSLTILASARMGTRHWRIGTLAIRATANEQWAIKIIDQQAPSLDNPGSIDMEFISTGTIPSPILVIDIHPMGPVEITECSINGQVVPLPVEIQRIDPGTLLAIHASIKAISATQSNTSAGIEASAQWNTGSATSHHDGWIIAPSKNQQRYTIVAPQERQGIVAVREYLKGIIEENGKTTFTPIPITNIQPIPTLFDNHEETTIAATTSAVIHPPTEATANTDVSMSGNPPIAQSITPPQPIRDEKSDTRPLFPANVKKKEIEEAQPRSVEPEQEDEEEEDADLAEADDDATEDIDNDTPSEFADLYEDEFEESAQIEKEIEQEDNLSAAEHEEPPVAMPLPPFVPMVLSKNRTQEIEPAILPERGEILKSLMSDNYAAPPSITMNNAFWEEAKEQWQVAAILALAELINQEKIQVDDNTSMMNLQNCYNAFITLSASNKKDRAEISKEIQRIAARYRIHLDAVIQAVLPDVRISEKGVEIESIIDDINSGKKDEGQMLECYRTMASERAA